MKTFHCYDIVTKFYGTDTVSLQGYHIGNFSCQIAQIWRFFKAFGMKILVCHFGIFFQSGNSATHLHLEIER